MINFERIVARDCFGYVLLDFTFENGLHSIEGINGSSKTSIFMALMQGLFNRNAKGTKIEEVNNYITGQPYEIEIYLTKGVSRYLIVNSRKAGNIEIFKDGKPKHVKRIPDNLKIIEDILGADFGMFQDLIYQSPKSSINLLENGSDNSRKAFLNRILKLDEIDESLEKFKAKEKELSRKGGILELLRNQIEKFESSIVEDYQEEKKEIDTSKLEQIIKNINADRDKYQIEITKLSAKLAQLSEERNQCESNKDIAWNIKQLKDHIQGFKLPNVSYVDLREVYEDACKQETIELTELSSSKKELHKLSEYAKIDLCPTCKQAVDTSSFITRIAEIKEGMEENSKRLASAQAIKDSCSLDIEVWEDFNATELKLTKFQALPATHLDYPKILENIQEIVNNRKDLQAKLNECNNQLSNAVQKLKQCQEFNTVQRTVKAVNSQKKAYNDATKLKLTGLYKELEEKERQQELLKIWILVLGPKGFRVHKMQSFLCHLNTAMKKYADMLSDGNIRCMFFMSEGEIDFTVIDSNKTISWACWSEGEKARVKMACLFAVLELLEVMGSVSFNVLALDEIFSSLDNAGKEGLFKVLNYLKDRGRAIYTIAHTKLAHDKEYDTVINATKLADGTTTINQ